MVALLVGRVLATEFVEVLLLDLLLPPVPSSAGRKEKKHKPTSNNHKTSQNNHKTSQNNHKTSQQHHKTSQNNTTHHQTITKHHKTSQQHREDDGCTINVLRALFLVRGVVFFSSCGAWQRASVGRAVHPQTSAQPRRKVSPRSRSFARTRL